MKTHRYSQWDGSQAEQERQGEVAVDALAEVMMHGVSADDALRHMQRFGFELAGRQARVLGAQDLMRELRKQARDRYEQHKLDQPFEDLKRRWRQIQALEEQTLQQQHGYESLAMNDFLERRHAPSQTLSDAIERFSDYGFKNEDAAEGYEELRAELERLRSLERFKNEQGLRFRGPKQAGYELAQQLQKELSAIEGALQALEQGTLTDIDPSQLSALLGTAATNSLIILRDLAPRLRADGYLSERDGELELTAKAVRRIGQRALSDVYNMLHKGRPGEHATSARGDASARPDETRPYRFGDALELDVTKSVLNALRRPARTRGTGGMRVALELDDLEVRERDFATDTTTVLLLDLSWSMSFEGRFPAAKRVALAMDHLIRTQFPRDHFFIVGFSTRARQLMLHELPAVSWDPSDPFTNLQEGLMVAERLIAAHPSPNPQVLVITDGQPTAYFRDEELHVEWPSGYGGVSPHAVAETLKQVHRITRRGVTINTFMLHDSPELVGFVERMTEINKGRALFTDPTQLGSYVMLDHIHRRKRSRG